MTALILHPLTSISVYSPFLTNVFLTFMPLWFCFVLQILNGAICVIMDWDLPVGPQFTQCYVTEDNDLSTYEFVGRGRGTLSLTLILKL